METKTLPNTSTITTETFTFKTYFCPHLLPCGLCDRTDRPCPKNNGTYDPWTPHWESINTSNSVGCEEHE